MRVRLSRQSASPRRTMDAREKRISVNAARILPPWTSEAGRGLRIILEGLVVLCAVSVGLPASPVRAAEWNPARDLPVSLALGPQLHWGRGP